MIRALAHPIETLRTAPVQFANIAVMTGATAVNATIAMEVASAPLDTIEWVMAGLSVAVAAGNAVLAKGRINIRNHLEEHLLDHGYNERAMTKTTREYCTRQAARIACENTGYIEQYDDLIERTKDTQEFSWLPHI